MKKNLKLFANIVLVILMASLTLIAMDIRISAAPESADLSIIPETVVKGNATGVDITRENFTIAVVIENIVNLYGLDVRIAWDPTYLQYIEHTVTMPIEDFPDPIHTAITLPRNPQGNPDDRKR